MIGIAKAGREGPILYADIRTGRSMGMVEPVPPELRRQVDNIIKRHGGWTLDSASQRFTAAFLRHSDALDCAHDIRVLVHKVAAQETSGSAPSSRVLLVHGMLPDPDSYEGSKIALALSMQLAQVPADSIAGLKDFLDRLPSKPQVIPHGHSTVDRKQSPLYLFAAAGFAITEEEKTSEMSVVALAAGSLYAELTLRTRGESRTVIQADCPVTIGRGKACGVVVDSPDASRVHGRIVYSKDKFLFEDSSRNGTFLLVQGGNELKLEKESLVLVGEGVISLGSPVSRQRGDLLFYSCNPVKLET